MADLKIEKADGDQYRIYGQGSQEGVAKDFRPLVPIQVEFGKNDLTRIGMVGPDGEATVLVYVTLNFPKSPKRGPGQRLGQSPGS